MKEKKRIKFGAWLPVVLWMGLIFWFSHQPGDVSGASSGWIVDLLHRGITTVLPFLELNEEFLHFLIRKGAHFGVYGVLGILLVRALRSSGYRGVQGLMYAWILAIIYAGSDEFHQTFIAGRSGEVRDVLIDSAGALAGIALYLLVTGIQRPEKVGKNTLQHVLIQESREKEQAEEDKALAGKIDKIQTDKDQRA